MGGITELVGPAGVGKTQFCKMARERAASGAMSDAIAQLRLSAALGTALRACCQSTQSAPAHLS